MKERLQACRGVEVSGLHPEQHIRAEQRAGKYLPAQFRKLVGQEQGPAKQQNCREHCDQCRKNSARPPRVKRDDAESALAGLINDEPGNEVAGDDEKHVHPDKPARNPARKGVKSDHGENRDGTQPIDVGPVGHPPNPRNAPHFADMLRRKWDAVQAVTLTCPCPIHSFRAI